MLNRNYTIDYIRVIALLFIVTCHYLLFSDVSNVGFGRYLAGVGNMVFFMISAFLYGEKYNVKLINKSYERGLIQSNHKHFILQRIIRLGSSLWPFLLILTILFLCFEVQFSWNDVLLNFLFLGYLGKLPGNGHLWFLTVMMLCYIEYVLIDKLQICLRNFSLIFLLVTLLLMICLELYDLPGNFIAILGFFFFFVVNISWINQSIKNKTIFYVIAIAFNVIFLYLSIDGLFENSRIIHYLLSDICGCLLLLLLLNILPNMSNRIFQYISNISFEIYLVHHTLCSGPFFRISSFTNNHFINYFLLFIISILLAWWLNLISKILNKTLSNLII